MEPEIREIESFIVVGVRERFDQETKHRIPALWQRFVPRIPEIASRRPGVTFGVCANVNPETGSFDYIAGVAVDSVDRVPEGLVAEAVPRRTYAVFTHHVQSTSLHQELQPTMRWIWGTWLPSAPYEYGAIRPSSTPRMARASSRSAFRCAGRRDSSRSWRVGEVRGLHHRYGSGAIRS